MSEYIKRESVTRMVASWSVGSYIRVPAKWAEEELQKIQASDVAPVRHGRWMKNDNGTWSCERCHSWIPDEQHYYARFCLYCGAKMDGGADGERKGWNE